MRGVYHKKLSSIFAAYGAALSQTSQILVLHFLYTRMRQICLFKNEIPKIFLVENEANQGWGLDKLGLNTVYQQPWHRVRSFSILIGCNLNDESVRKILKTQLRYEISNGLQLQSTKDQETVLQFTRKQLLDNEMFNLHKRWDVSRLAKKIKSTGHEI